MAVVATLRVAPVKGLATVTRRQLRLDRDGAAEDRRVFLLDGRGAVVTLRSHPQLVQAVPDLDLENRVLAVRLPDGERVSSPLDAANGRVTAELYGKRREGRLLAGEVADGLSVLAGEPLQVVVADRTGVGWDEGPVSILGRASATAVGGPDRDRARYRMMIELDGSHAYEEDRWIGREVAVGDARLRVTQALVRCVIITQSPTTGRHDWDGLKVLARTRGDDLCLGVIADVVAPGTVRVGDETRLVA